MKYSDELELNAAIEKALECVLDEDGTSEEKMLAEWLLELRMRRKEMTTPPPTIPDDYVDQVDARDREKDLLTLSRAIVLDRMTTTPSVFTDYALEGGDLLYGAINDALETVTPRNLVAAEEWQEYMLGLFNDARQCVLDLIASRAWH